MTELGLFYRLFLYTPAQAEAGSHFEVWVRPDPKQPKARSEPAMKISCADIEGLEVCLRELGAVGWSRYIGEQPGGGGPVFEFVPCTTEQVLAFLRSQPPSPFGHVTLIAANTSSAEMKRRLERLGTRQHRSIQIGEPA